MITYFNIVFNTSTTASLCLVLEITTRILSSEHLGRCIYEGTYVGENSKISNTNGMRNDVVEALKEMKIPVLRWPDGCFADEYHWKDGIGENENRKK